MKRIGVVNVTLSLAAGDATNRWLAIKSLGDLMLLDNDNALRIGHFRITSGLFFEASLGANQFSFTRKLNSFSCDWKLICIWKDEHQDSFRKRGLHEVIRKLAYSPKENKFPKQLSRYRLARCHFDSNRASLRYYFFSHTQLTFSLKPQLCEIFIFIFFIFFIPLPHYKYEYKIFNKISTVKDDMERAKYNYMPFNYEHLFKDKK